MDRSSGRETRFGVVNLIGYSLGDAGFNLLWILTDTFLVYFLTEAAGFRIQDASIIVLAGRAGDIVCTIVAGFILDRTRTRFGAYRPYLLWFGVPLGCTVGALFSVHAGGAAGAIISNRPVWIAAGLYTAFAIFYSISNIAYTAIPAVITSDQSLRSRMVAVRFLSASVTSLAMQAAAMSLVSHMGEGSQQRGWSRVATACAVAGVCLIQIAFFSTSEKLPPAEQDRHKRPQFEVLLRGELTLLLFAFVAITAAVSCRSIASIYFVRDCLGRGEDTGKFLGVGAAAALPMCAALTFTRLSGPTLRVLLVVLTGISSLGSIVFFFFAPGDWWLALMGQALFGAASAALYPLVFTSVANIAGKASTVSQTAGFISMLALMALKAGAFVGAWLCTSVLAGSWEGTLQHHGFGADGRLRIAMAIVPCALLAASAMSAALAGGTARRAGAA